MKKKCIEVHNFAGKPSKKFLKEYNPYQKPHKIEKTKEKILTMKGEQPVYRVYYKCSK